MQQVRLLTWMDCHIADVQVVSVARHPVFPLVLAGTFLNKLYYRLNTLYLPLSECPTVEVDAGSLSARPRHTATMERVFEAAQLGPLSICLWHTDGSTDMTWTTGCRWSGNSTSIGNVD